MQRINAKSYGLGSRLSAGVFLAYDVDANLSCGDGEKYSKNPCVLAQGFCEVEKIGGGVR